MRVVSAGADHSEIQRKKLFSDLPVVASTDWDNRAYVCWSIIGKHFYPITSTIFETVLVSEIQNSGTHSFREHFEIISDLWTPVNKT